MDAAWGQADLAVAAAKAPRQDARARQVDKQPRRAGEPVLARAAEERHREAVAVLPVLDPALPQQMTRHVMA